MATKVGNNAVYAKLYNHWGFIQNNMQCKNIIRQENGYLWAVIADSTATIRLMRSTDNGYTWQSLRSDVSSATRLRCDASLNSDGSMQAIAVNEEWNIVDIISTEKALAGTYDIWRDRYELSGITIDTTDATALDADTYQGAFDYVYNTKEGYLIYVDTGDTNKISLRRCSPRTNSFSSKATITLTNCFNFFAATCDTDSNVDLIFCHQLTGVNYVKHARYTPAAGWGTVNTVQSLADTNTEPMDFGIASDSNNTLCAVWGKRVDGASTIVPTYAISTDAGVTWTVTALTRTTGHAIFTDQATGDEAARTQVIGSSNGGFLMAYIEKNNVGNSKAWVRRIKYTSGAYVLGEEREIGTNITKTSDNITGMRFIMPSVGRMNLDDPGQARVAVQVGDGSSTISDDDVPVKIYSTTLWQDAYVPTYITSVDKHRSIDVADADSLLVKVNVVGSPSEYKDFYAHGMTGAITDRYLAAFEKIGTTIQFLKYEPSLTDTQNDRGSYGDPTNYTSKAILAPASYEDPIPDIAATGINEWTERDTRKIYLPPDFFLSRNFIVNKGGFLKRTVWSCLFTGNEYEITQVVPFFLDNQLAYWNANAYVIGPSRDPFSRSILTSET